MSKKMMHIVSEQNELKQLSPLSFPYFSLCLTFTRQYYCNFIVLYYGNTEKKMQEKLEWLGGGLKVEIVS